MLKAVLGHEGGRAAIQQHAAYRVLIRIICIQDLFQRPLEKVADDDALADMEIPLGIDVDSAWIRQVFVGA